MAVFCKNCMHREYVEGDFSTAHRCLKSRVNERVTYFEREVIYMLCSEKNKDNNCEDHKYECKEVS